MAYNDNIVAKILEQCDIVELIGGYIPIQPKGSGFVALCPFHDDSKPSLNIVPDKQIYKCFSCDAGGDAIQFVREYEKLSFGETLQLLCERYNIELPKDITRPHTSPHQQQSVLLLDVLSKASAYYQNNFKGSVAEKYALARGLTQEAISNFTLGYAPPNANDLQSTLSNKLLVQSGLWSEKRDKANFLHRLIFPVRDTRGKVITFGGRALDEQQVPKYLNGPETLLFSKAKQLFGLYEALQKKRTRDYIVIVEGYMDVISLHARGHTNTVAVMGTAPSEYHYQQLFRYTNEIVLCFDGDQAGRGATKRAVKLAMPYLRAELSLRVCLLPQDKDPDGLAQQGANPEEFLYYNSLPLSDYLFHHYADIEDISTPESKAKILTLLAPLIGTMPRDTLQTLFIKALSDYLQMPLALHTENKKSFFTITHSMADNNPKNSVIRRSDAQEYKSKIMLNHLDDLCYVVLHDPSLVANINDSYKQIFAANESIQARFLTRIFSLYASGLANSPIYLVGALQSDSGLYNYGLSLLQGRQKKQLFTQEQLSNLLENALRLLSPDRKNRLQNINKRLKKIFK